MVVSNEDKDARGSDGRPLAVHKDIVWNLAIGSNMDEAKLRGRAPSHRKPIDPLLPGVPAVAAGFALSFDMMLLPPTEPVMAGAVRRPGGALHGVLYKLSREDYHTLALTEGVVTSRRSLYEELVVDAAPYAGRAGYPAKVRAVVFALRYPAPTPLSARGMYPSSRYATMMVRGARTAGLDPAVVAELEARPTARPVSPRLRGYARLSFLGAFLLYKNELLLLLMRRTYKPALAAVFSRRESAHADAAPRRETLWTLVMCVLMFPMVALGFFRALFLRRNVLQILSGVDSPAPTRQPASAPDATAGAAPPAGANVATVAAEASKSA